LVYSTINDKKFTIVFAGWWVLWICLRLYVLLDNSFLLKPAFTDSLVVVLLLAISCLSISNNLRYYLPRKEKYIYILVVSLGLSFFCVLLQKFFLMWWLKNDINYLAFVSNTLSLRFVESFLLIGCMAALSLLWYSQKEQKETIERKAEAENLEREAELFKLRQQLQPHFLFNSLNSISALTIVQPEKARYMIQQLSDFLRGTLKKDDKQWNTLEEELEHLQLYLEIEKVRFGHRLLTNIQYDEKLLQTKMPSLLIQPVVENAIKFGLYDTTGEVCISIIATKENNHLAIMVQNPFDKETAQPLQGTGFGLASIQRRLFLLFGRQDLIFTKTENGFFFTTIIIPPIQ
jgi:sensor histidine kinase YesM